MRVRYLAATALLAVGLLAGCGRAADPTPGPTSSVPAPSTQPAVAGPAELTLAVSPADGSADLPVSTEIGIALGGGSIESVTVTRAGDATPLAGALREDGSSWVPAGPLAYRTAYTATVTATGATGSTTATTTFTTMGRPGHIIYTGLYAFDGQTVGVAHPLTVEFDEPIPVEARAAIQQRLFVTTNPPQPGVWSWPEGGRQVWYRAPDYWQPGTTITIRAALEGMPMGGNAYGDIDRTATVTVGDKIFMDVDNVTKQMNVYVNDELARTMPVSLGKPSTPSSSGFMVTMSHDFETTFDTRGEPNGGYVTDVNYAMRLTWGGEFIHAAPWSVAQQGNTNVSHGCVNMSNENALWLFDLTHIGDPIIVRGTEVTLVNGNGWTAWNIPWTDYVAGSALPVPGKLAHARAVDPITGASPA